MTELLSDLHLYAKRPLRRIGRGIANALHQLICGGQHWCWEGDQLGHWEMPRGERHRDVQVPAALSPFQSHQNLCSWPYLQRVRM